MLIYMSNFIANNNLPSYDMVVAGISIKGVVLKLDAKNIQAKLNMSHHNLRRTIKVLMDIKMTLDNTERTRINKLVESLDYIKKTHEYILRVPDMAYEYLFLLNKYIKEKNNTWTIINEKEAYNLKLKHSKRLYLLLRKLQNQTFSVQYFNLDEFNSKFRH